MQRATDRSRFRSKRERQKCPAPPSSQLIEKRNGFTRISLQFVFNSMKKSSWFFVIVAAAATLALSSCANQEGVGANPAELPERPQKAN
jgi:hypothetical protein